MFDDDEDDDKKKKPKKKKKHKERKQSESESVDGSYKKKKVCSIGYFVYSMFKCDSNSFRKKKL